ncbi:DUF460 domain-containing protein [Methanospirillum stamsii]|uniref:DUF460 domain-containing protein n=1 Tax=Methanospirillum stamsii TaxID=1277351 RepID=A0A2V2NG90_9EURY|nr:DUF460 domain-containing protein [Methanospirillum stamsii]PWR75398.1 DUF460 domain-containing protein [Methanospirillum stamsii]
MLIFGIDLITGSVRSRTVQPKYALVIAKEGKIIRELAVSLHRLIRLIHRDQPDILAVDSVQEIAPHTQDLYRFLELLPSKTMFVVVTGGDRQTGLIQVAARYNISFDRFDPFAEARAIAEVAHHGAGSQVVAFEKETEITITRNRSPGKGGWSQNRYARKIHGNVLRYAREVEHDLQSSGLSFWKKEYKAFGGVSRVSFHVREKRDLIPVTSSRGGDVQIRLSGKRLDRIQYRPISARPKYLIVGIDPGTTIGIAVLDLNGELIKVHSSRQMTMGDVTEFLWSLGKPLIIASDVVPMPFSVEKIRRAFQATPHTPKTDISVETKYELAGKFGYGNDHERDALTAAIEAYRFWNHKFTGILKRVPYGVDLEEVKAGIIRGQSLEQILAGKRDTVRSTEEKKPEVILDSSDERVRILDGKVKDLRLLVADLQNEITSLKHENKTLSRRITGLKTERDKGINIDPAIIKRDQIIANLRHRLKQEEKNNKKLHKRLKRLKETTDEERPQGTRVVKVIADLSRDNVRLLSERVGIIKDDILYVKSLSAWGKGIVHDLAKAGVESVILNEKSAETLSNELKDIFLEEGLPLVLSRDMHIQVKGDVGTCDEEPYADALDSWNDDYQQYLKGKSEMMLDDLMKEYIAERERKVK